eukprot:scaffold9940_cov161-Amphora_coffeaeformis.AAC.8
MLLQYPGAPFNVIAREDASSTKSPVEWVAYYTSLRLVCTCRMRIMNGLLPSGSVHINFLAPLVKGIMVFLLLHTKKGTARMLILKASSRVSRKTILCCPLPCKGIVPIKL